jgi:hypothetical protein
MYEDAHTLLWAAAALTSDAVSTNTYDCGAATDDVSRGEPLCAVICVIVAADFTTANETYQFNLLQDAAADLNTADILLSRVIAASALTAGSVHIIPFPPGAITKRYLGLGYDGGGTTPTITVTAWITAMSMIHMWKSHPDGFTITG